MSFLAITAFFFWLTSQLSKLSFNVEQVTLEFLLLGRIPGTDFFMPFELIFSLAIIVSVTVVMAYMLKDPNPVQGTRRFN